MGIQSFAENLKSSPTTKNADSRYVLAYCNHNYSSIESEC